MTRRNAAFFALTLLVICAPSLPVPARALEILNGDADIRGYLVVHLPRPDCPIGVIDTIAGGAVGDGGRATEATLYKPSGVAVAPDGSIYIADYAGSRVRRVDPRGRISTIAGNDGHLYGGDSNRADTVSLDCPTGVALGGDGSVFIAEQGCHRIRKVARNGIITTVAGNGETGHAGESGPATDANLYHPTGIAAGPDGSIYIADRDNNAIRKVDPAGIITTVAGVRPPPFDIHRWGAFLPSTGRVAPVGAYPGDNGPATKALLERPHAVALAPDGSLYFADTGHSRIRKVDRAGIITTVAGGGSPAEGIGDGGLATEARLSEPRGVAVARDGSIYVADTYNNRIRKIDPAGIITTVAGSGRTGSSGGGFAGDGGPATEALLRYPEGVTIGRNGDLYIADTFNHRVRKVNATGIITTVAGGALGDGGQASKASIYRQLGIAAGPDGSLYFSEWDDNRVRRIGPDGIITTIAGNGLPGYSGDGGPATKASLLHPKATAVGPDRSLYIADYGNDRVRKVDSAGIITTVAGNGDHNYSGDGGPATQAALCRPAGVAVAADGTLYIADRENHRIRKVDPAGIITTVAGTGKPQNSGDGGPAVKACLNEPLAVALGPDGSLYIADGRNYRIRKVDPAGTIMTIAGKGGAGYSGDGGPATEAHLSWGEVHSLAVAADGSLYIPDERNHRIRKVYPPSAIQGMYGGLAVDDSFAGYGAIAIAVIYTIAGDGYRSAPRDGARATEAGLCYPNGVALGQDGTLYIADEGNHSIRRVRWWPCEPEAAMELAGKLRADAGNSLSAWRELAELYLIAGAWDEAAAAAERVLAIAPESDTATRLRADVIAGRAYAAKRDDHEARRRLIRVLARTTDPLTLRQAGEALVDLYLVRGERQQAIATLNDLRTRTRDRGLLAWIDRRLKEIVGD